MNAARFLVAFLTLMGTTVGLYLLGHALSIPWLMFSHEFANDAGGFHYSVGSLVPLIVGVIASGVAEAIYTRKQRQTFAR